MYNHKEKILAVLVYLERRKRRKFVGKLTYDEKNKIFIFLYDEKYLASKLIPLGPELPLRRKPFVSEKLFESFVDRIPSKENPSYIEYCQMFKIDPEERNPMVLLTTIARRGPSSFIFEPQVIKTFNAADLILFRKELHLTTKEFAIGFSISEKTLIAIEKGQRKGKEVMKRLELYIKFPEVALFEFKRSCAEIHVEKRRHVEQVLSRKYIRIL